MLENLNTAIGKIKELPLQQPTELDAQRILAIAYFHDGVEEKVEEVWGELKI